MHVCMYDFLREYRYIVYIMLTKSASNDMAVAKKMQITIPANVLYLGPISSRAI